MTINSPAVLLVQNDVEPGREPAFDSWYLADHMPDRVDTPGFLRARRWRAFAGGPRDLSLYELDGPEVMSSAPYLARLANPTEGTRLNMDAFIGMQRSVCEVRGAVGFADGGCAVLIPAAPAAGAAWPGALFAAESWRPDADTGVVARALLRCNAQLSRSDSAESRLRKGMDRTIETAAWIEAASPDQARAATNVTAQAMRSAGLEVGSPVLLQLVATFCRP